MIDFFRRKKEKHPKDNEKEQKIVVIKKSDPHVCGGTDATQDINAPKTIDSKDITVFDVTSALHTVRTAETGEENRYTPGYVSAFAVPAKKGTFMFLETGESFHYRDKRDSVWALVKENPFTELAELVKKYDLACKNGFHSRTHGLPENFGGSVYILYADGEKISFSNNQVPIITSEAGLGIADFFKGKISGTKVCLPAADDIIEIRYFEEHENGAFTESVLTIRESGGILRKTVSSGNSEARMAEHTVSEETVDTIKKTVENCGVFAWEGIPDGIHRSNGCKTLTFKFRNTEEITVKNHRLLPEKIGEAFFRIELEMTVRY
jgi:hypothetical protein